MAEQDTLASHFGGHPIPTEKVTERVSRWTFVSLGKASADDTSNTTVYDQDRFASNASIIPPWNPQVNATAVGLLQRGFLPALTTNTTLSLISYTIARLTNRLDLKDVVWPLGPLISSWTIALQRHNFDLSKTWTNMAYPQKLIMAGLTTWSLRLFYRITSRAISRGKDDARYTSESSKNSDYWNKCLFSTFVPEALVQSIIALPFTMCLAAPEVLIANQSLSRNPGWKIAHAVGVFLFSAGFALEAGADLQLENYKSKKNENEGLLKDGIWSIVRHPNYLGDTLIHTSFPLILYGAGLFHPLMLLAPITNYTFLRYVGGDAQTEKYQQERYEKIGSANKLEDFSGLKSGKNSVWPGVEEWGNVWLWSVLACGAMGVVGSGG
ncbi:23b522b2-6e94-4ad7-b337-27d3130882d3 [Sclerotinia trifoliorum]|uniref:23b522b2-6e94-4ad7-b337-27d3130882d3 n=1 Tax=Sclerotinia trifoliorum TaxID=28548 RepID=A0A8H2VVW5_9HELO|nr:23b522b2-6e94-4ad7-b337-27d3130882d3 [Sclerotinia trifoliorum]